MPPRERACGRRLPRQSVFPTASRCCRRCPVAVTSPAGTCGQKGKDSASGASQKLPRLQSDEISSFYSALTSSCPSGVHIHWTSLGLGENEVFLAAEHHLTIEALTSKSHHVWRLDARVARGSWDVSPSLPACSGDTCRPTACSESQGYCVQIVA